MIVLACYAYEVNLPPILINYRPVLVKIWKVKNGPTVKFLPPKSYLTSYSKSHDMLDKFRGLMGQSNKLT